MTLIKVGIVLRSFARTPDKTAETAGRVAKAFDLIGRVEGKDWYVSHVLVLIPKDRSYHDSDSGHLMKKMREDNWRRRSKAAFFIREVSGDLFVGLQNWAIRFFRRDWHDSDHEHVVDLVIMAAPSAIVGGSLSWETLGAAVEAYKAGAKIIPVAVADDGLDEVVSRGTAGGSIVAWDLKALIEVGGFNEAAAQHKLGGKNPNAGCETIHPIVHIMRKYGACYAPIMPQGGGIKGRELKGERFKRHEEQVATKTSRQLAHARSLGVDDLAFFAEHVMPEYKI